LNLYPADARARNEWILAKRPALARPRIGSDAAAFVEREPTETGEIADVATLLLVGGECRFRCVFCDLWKGTHEEPTPRGAVPVQIVRALERLPRTRRLKLYNASSWFDERSVPEADDAAVAELADNFERVIVESHPALVGARAFRFARLLGGRLEVAMGLETVHPDVLPRLNKGMTVATFDRAAGALGAHGIAVRAFVLAGLPFVARAETVEWAVRSAAHAFEAGAWLVSLIPLRLGNGALEALESEAPRLADLEDALDGALALSGGVVTADLWDLERLARCAACFAARRARLEAMNLSQHALPRVACSECGGAS
jgi:uncharacterized Fe-S cluster-containing MiaB family protein